MPGKVNPSVPEAVNMLTWQVIGNDTAILMAAQSGQLELNFGTPLIAHNLLQSMDLLRNGTQLFRDKCISGLKVDEKRCRELLDRSFVYATALTPALGYTVVSKLVREAQQKDKPLKELVLEKKLLDKKELERILSMEKRAKPSER
jgi:aspartate ammonia-lyase